MGYSIRERREALNMSQEELAKKSGISRQTISALESGKSENVLVGTLAAIATALDTTVDQFFLNDVSKQLNKED
ncbi:MAG: helix-turn-helix transcriptional regulator [Oscillospiraceae bacterium]|nr:helix-turn-helix transcriptional regulator [Oscillospiraceae bacterium]